MLPSWLDKYTVIKYDADAADFEIKSESVFLFVPL